MRHFIVALMLSVTTLVTVTAQEEKQLLPIKISILDESISVPNFWFLRYSYNPAVMIGTEWIWKEKEQHDWHITSNLGFYHHKDWETGLFLNAELGYRQYLGRYNVTGRFGIGYAHTFSPVPVYQYKEGNYEEVTDFGSPTFMPSFALGIGYDLKKERNSPEIFLTYMFAPMLPFNQFTSPRQLVGLGLKLYPFQNLSLAKR